MALSAFAFTEDCIPPNNFVDLAYHPSVPDNLNNTPVIGSTYSSDLSLALGSNLTIPTSCGTGMDVVFLVDYTGSMSSAIEGVKTGINNILSTIDTESNGNYRVGLCIFDETPYSVTAPTNYGTNINYTSLPSAQKVEISTNANKKQWITCLETLGTVGSTNTFVNQLNKLNGALPLGTGQNSPEPGGLAVNEIVSNSIAGSFRSESSKIIILITDAVPGGDDDYDNLIDDNYFNNVLTPLCDSYNVQVMIQSTLASNFQNNFYYDLSQGTTPIGRYDQVTFDVSGNWINSGLIQGIEGICGSTYTHTCNDAPTGWYHEGGSDYAWYFNNSTGTITNSYSFPPIYNVIARPGTAGEDNVTITFLVSTGYVPNGTTLYWNMSNGNTDANDFTNNIHYGSFTINSEGFGSFTLTTKPDNITDGVESLIVTLRTGSAFGTIVATSNTVKILDSSLSPTAVPPTPTPSPTPTATPSPTAIPTGTCQNTWIHPDVDGMKYGLRWKKPSGEYITARFNAMLSTPTWRNGIEGYVISVCSNEAVQAFNFELGDSEFLSTDLFARLASGGTCERDRDCIYDAPSPTSTPVPPTSTPVPPTSTPYPTPTPASTDSGGGAGIVAAGYFNNVYTIQPQSSSTETQNSSFNLYLVSNVNWRLESTGTLLLDNVLTGTPQTVADEFEINIDVNKGGTIKLIDNSTDVVLSTYTVYIELVVVTPTPTPTSWVYKMDPCDGVSAYVYASSNTTKQLLGIYSLTGSFHAGKGYTLIGSVNDQLASTTVGLQLESCPTDGGEEPIRP